MNLAILSQKIFTLHNTVIFFLHFTATDPLFHSILLGFGESPSEVHYLIVAREQRRETHRKQKRAKYSRKECSAIFTTLVLT